MATLDERIAQLRTLPDDDRPVWAGGDAPSLNLTPALLARWIARAEAREDQREALLVAREADIQLLRDFNAAPAASLTLLQVVAATKAQNRCLLALARLAGG